MAHIIPTNVQDDVRCDTVTTAELRIRVSNTEGMDPCDDAASYISSEWDDDTIVGDEDDGVHWMNKMDRHAQDFGAYVRLRKFIPSMHVFVEYMVMGGRGYLSDDEWMYLMRMNYRNYL